MRVTPAEARKLGVKVPRGKVVRGIGMRPKRPLTPLAKALAKKKRERYEDALAAHLDQAGIRYSRQVGFDPTRRWLADFMVIATNTPTLLVEVDGGTWQRGSRSHSGGGHEADCERDAAALAGGRLVLRVTPHHVTSGLAIEWVKAVLARWKWGGNRLGGVP